MEEIKVYDDYDQRVTMLVQWDLDIYLTIKEDKITKDHNVHLFNTENDVAYVVTSTYSDGKMRFKIPNRLLFSALPITGYVYITEDDESYRSIFVFTVLVRARAVPSDFAYVNDDSDDYINVEKVLAECIAYAESAAASAYESDYWSIISKSWAVGDTGYRDGEDTDCSKYYCLEAEQAATAAVYSAESAADSRDKSATSEANAATSESNAKDYETLAQSYAVGGTGTRTGEDEDNAYFYYLQCGRYAASFEGILRPMGSVYFADLPSVSKSTAGDLYNIIDTFTTTSDFLEGEGIVVPYGSDIYLTTDGQWDVLGGTGAYDAVDMIMTGEATAFLLDENGQVILSDSDTGIVLSWELCQYNETEKARVDALESELNMVKVVADDLEARVYELEIKTMDDVEESDIDSIFISTTQKVSSADEVLVEDDYSIMPLADGDEPETVYDMDDAILEVADLETRVATLEAKLADDVSESDIDNIFYLLDTNSTNPDDDPTSSPSSVPPSETGDPEETGEPDGETTDDGDTKLAPGIEEPDNGEDNDSDDGDNTPDDDDNNPDDDTEPDDEDDGDDDDTKVAPGEGEIAGEESDDDSLTESDID